MLNRKTKKDIEIFLDLLRASQGVLFEIGHNVSNRGLRIDLAELESDTRALIAKTENVIYEPEPETGRPLEIYRYTTDDKSVRFIEE